MMKRIHQRVVTWQPASIAVAETPVLTEFEEGERLLSVSAELLVKSDSVAAAAFTLGDVVAPDLYMLAADLSILAGATNGTLADGSGAAFVGVAAHASGRLMGTATPKTVILTLTPDAAATVEPKVRFTFNYLKDRV